MAAKNASQTHLRKRQYQPSISSYFSKSTDPSSSQPSAPSLAPVLPAETQSMLLNVGMRVRKAVPEGYKTHKTLPFTPLSHTAPANTTAPSSAPSTTTIMQSRHVNQGYSRELTPFCGLHKVGGLAAQENWNPSSSAPASLSRDGDDHHDWEVPGLSFSQGSFASTQESFDGRGLTTTRLPVGKRSYEEDVEAEMDAFFDEMDDENSSRQEQAVSMRRIARPRNHASRKNVPMVFVANDFEDAGFLAPLDGMEMDGNSQF